MNISGITLTVDASGDQPAEALSYYKSATQVINIGRRSSHAENGSHEVGRALFRCPIVSRKHAKITFTEYGNAYIIDLNSHHGTYILRPRETVLQAVKPEIHTVLADGDKLIFGKRVGQDDNVVDPITVNVKLLYEPEPEPEVALATKTASDSPRKPVVRPPSGRYGLLPLSSDSSPTSSDSDKDSDSDSDIQILPPSCPPNNTSSQQTQQSGVEPSRPQSFLSRTAFLRRLLPPICNASLCDHREDADAEEGSFSSLRKRLGFSNPAKQIVKEVIEPSESIAAGPSTSGRISGYSTLSSMLLPHQPVMRSPSYTPLIAPLRESQDLPNPITSTTPADIIAAHREESMELATPEPQGGNLGTQADSVAQPDITFAIDTISVAANASVSSPDMSISSSSPSADSNSLGERNFDGMQAEFEDAFSDPYAFPFASFGVTQNMQGPTNVRVERRISELSRDIAVFSDDVGELRTTSDDHERRFDELVQETKARLSALEQRVLDTNVRITSSTAATDVQMTDMTSRLDKLHETVTLNQIERSTTRDSEHENCMHDVKAALQEIRAFCENTERQLGDERKVVLELISEAKAAAEQVQTQEQTGLKRKRTSTDEGALQCEDVVPTIQTEHEQPSHKRRKITTVVSKVVKTATAASVGAFMAWYALASIPD